MERRLDEISCKKNALNVTGETHTEICFLGSRPRHILFYQWQPVVEQKLNTRVMMGPSSLASETETQIALRVHNSRSLKSK